MQNLSVTFFQSDLHWENKAENLTMFGQKIDLLNEPTDLILLPEMFTTGFSMQPEKFAEKINGVTVNWMREKAQQKNCVICGSFICEENGNYYNRLIWMRADGTYNTYDKRHLFSMGDENNHYQAGSKKILEVIKGWKICPLICYDLRFPVWSRNSSANSYDLLIYIANWPERRNHPWKILLQARAIENQTYVVGLNRVGNDGNQIYHSGDSAIVNFKGEVISKTEPHEQKAETLELHYAELLEFRKQFPVLNDADGFQLNV